MRNGLLVLIMIISVSGYATEPHDSEVDAVPHIIRISLWTTDEGVVCTINDHHTTIQNIGKRLEPLIDEHDDMRILILVVPTVPAGTLFDVLDVIRDYGLSDQVILARLGDGSYAGHTIKLDPLDDFLEPENDEEENNSVEIEIILDQEQWSLPMTRGRAILNTP